MPHSPRTFARSAAPSPFAHPLVSQTCRQMAQATEAAAVCSGCLEGLQHVHHRSAQRTTLRLTQVAEQMRRLSNPLEFFGLQSILMHCLVQDMGQLYQDMSHLLQHTTENTLRLQGVWTQAQLTSAQAVEAEPDDQAQEVQEPSAAPPATAADAVNAATQAASAATAALLQSWSSMMGSASGMASGQAVSGH